MDKQQVLDKLNVHRDRLDEFAVKSLFLFGSVARNEATSDSDVDFLVEFTRPVGLFTLLGLKTYSEELLGCPVDVGTQSSLRPHLRETVASAINELEAADSVTPWHHFLRLW